MTRTPANSDAEKKFCLQVAAEILRAMSETGMTFEELDKHIGKGRYAAKRFVNSLSDGKTTGVAGIVAMAEVLGVVPVFCLKVKSASPEER